MVAAHEVPTLTVHKVVTSCVLKVLTLRVCQGTIYFAWLET